MPNDLDDIIKPILRASALSASMPLMLYELSSHRADAYPLKKSSSLTRSERAKRKNKKNAQRKSRFRNRKGK